MAQAKGTATVDFGATPTQVATVTVTGQTDIAATDYVEAWFQGTDSTADHGTYHHAVMLPTFVRATAENIVAGSSFDLRFVSTLSLTGQIKVRWARSD